MLHGSATWRERKTLGHSSTCVMAKMLLLLSMQLSEPKIPCPPGSLRESTGLIWPFRSRRWPFDADGTDLYNSCSLRIGRAAPFTSAFWTVTEHFSMVMISGLSTWWHSRQRWRIKMNVVFLYRFSHSNSVYLKLTLSSFYIIILIHNLIGL